MRDKLSKQHIPPAWVLFLFTPCTWQYHAKQHATDPFSTIESKRKGTAFPHHPKYRKYGILVPYM